MEWNPLISAGRLPSKPREIWSRTVARESNMIGKNWNDLNVLADNRMRWKTDVIDSVYPPWDR